MTEGAGISEMLHRRHRLQLDLEADSIKELVRRLEYIAFSIEAEADKGRDQREWTSGGYSSGHHLTLVTNPYMTGERYREWLVTKPWRAGDGGQG